MTQQERDDKIRASVTSTVKSCKDAMHRISDQLDALDPTDDQSMLTSGRILAELGIIIMGPKE